MNDALDQSIKSRTKSKFNQLLSLGSVRKSKEKQKNDSSEKDTLVETEQVENDEDREKETVEDKNIENQTENNKEKRKRKKKKKREKKDKLKPEDHISNDGLEKTLGEKIELKTLKNEEIENVPESFEHQETTCTEIIDTTTNFETEIKEKEPKEEENTEKDGPSTESVNSKEGDEMPKDIASSTENLPCYSGDATKQNESDMNVFCVCVHSCDQLSKYDFVTQPVVKVHIIDFSSGKYMNKSSKDRRATSFYEPSSVEYIMPIQSKPFDTITNRTLAPHWEEIIIFNESFTYLLSQETLLIFEILESAVTRTTQKVIKTKKGSHLCWAFLKLKGANGVLNIEKKLRLQLYKPVALKNELTHGACMYNLWRNGKRVPYNSTLYITVKSSVLPQNLPHSLRSLYPTQEEISSEDRFNELRNNSKSATKVSDRPLWNRLPMQSYRIPNELHLSIKPSLKGCFVVRFSKNGRFLACGCRNELSYPLALFTIPNGELKYEFTGHAGIIYDIDWSKTDKYILSSSADCTVQIWDAKNYAKFPLVILPHPAFVYTAKFHSVIDNLVTTGCYDSLVRVWCFKEHDGTHNAKLVQELNGHRSHVNSLCFTDEGHKLYSADGVGKILVWNSYFTEQPSKKGASRDWTLFNEIEDPEFKGECINYIEMLPNNHKLIVHTRNNLIKLFDMRVSAITVRIQGFTNYQEFIRSCISPCGTYLFSGSEDGFVYVWRCDTGELVHVYKDLPFKSSIMVVNFHPHDNIIVMCANGRAEPVILYKYNFERGEFDGNKLNLSKEKDTVKSKKEKGKHVSFDDGIKKASKIKKALKIMDSVLTSSFTADDSSMVTDKTQSTNISTDHSILKSSVNPAALSPHAFLIPELAAQFQKQVLNHSQSSLNQTNVEVSTSSLTRTPSFTFKVPSSEHSGISVKALHDYSAVRSDELSFIAGENLRIIYKDSDTWWMGEKVASGEQGFIPAKYVKTLKY